MTTEIDTAAPADPAPADDVGLTLEMLFAEQGRELLKRYDVAPRLIEENELFEPATAVLAAGLVICLAYLLPQPSSITGSDRRMLPVHVARVYLLVAMLLRPAAGAYHRRHLAANGI